MERVQKVEGGLEIDAVGVLCGRDVWHIGTVRISGWITTLQRLTGYAQEATVHTVTD
jgi:hypothetical protein